MALDNLPGQNVWMLGSCVGAGIELPDAVAAEVQSCAEGYGSGKARPRNGPGFLGNGRSGGHWKHRHWKHPERHSQRKLRPGSL